MTEQPTAPPGEAAGGRSAGHRVAVEVGALERAVTRLDPVSGSLRLGSTRLVRTTADPGDPPAGDHVVDLQEAASAALLALSLGLEESARVLARIAQHHAGLDADVGQELRRTRGEGP